VKKLYNCGFAPNNEKKKHAYLDDVLFVDDDGVELVEPGDGDGFGAGGGTAIAATTPNTSMHQTSFIFVIPCLVTVSIFDLRVSI